MLNAESKTSNPHSFSIQHSAFSSMASSTYILCPGQGAQAVGMGKAFFDKSVAAKALFEKADDLLGFKLSEVCFAGPEERLHQTDVSQPALYVAGVASYLSA